MLNTVPELIPSSPENRPSPIYYGIVLLHHTCARLRRTLPVLASAPAFFAATTVRFAAAEAVGPWLRFIVARFAAALDVVAAGR